ncbi:MAG: transposase [Candidatus Poribacteria bacterium]|nr:transposase [Candidatus Poribacteria bacterium]
MKRLWGRKVSDIAFGELLEKIRWQAEKRVKEVGIIDRWEPTTSVCHQCSSKVELELRDREWTCSDCNTHHDRDLNAAINVCKVGASTFEVGDVRLALASCL